MQEVEGHEEAGVGDAVAEEQGGSRTGAGTHDWTSSGWTSRSAAGRREAGDDEGSIVEKEQVEVVVQESL